jgi:WD40 repeat protein
MLLFVAMRDEKGPMHKVRQRQGTSRGEQRRSETRKRSTAGQTPAALWHRFHWVGLCLSLLVAACTSAPAPRSVTPAASGSAQATTITAYHGHTSTIFAVAWSPDGRCIASGGNDSTVQIWDGMNGHHLLTYRGQTAPVRGVAWSPNGTRIASASQDGTVQVWDATSGRHLLTYRDKTALL